MENRILTVIIPIYNKQNLLRQCLDSFAVKSFTGRLEVLAIDDGSSDASLSIALEYNMVYPEIFKVIHKENGGVGSVMNTGLKNASGKYIKEVDADDYVHSDAMEDLLNFLGQCDSDMVLNPFEEVDASMRSTSWPWAMASTSFFVFPWWLEWYTIAVFPMAVSPPVYSARPSGFFCP